MRLALALFALLAAADATAHASTVGVFRSESGVRTLTVRGEPGQNDDLTVSRIGGELELVDRVTEPKPGAGCRVTAPRTARCTISGTLTLFVAPGDGDDVVQIASDLGSTLPVRVEGGLGDDRLVGGPGGDVLEGGAGVDVVDGAGGDDTVEDDEDPFAQEADRLEGGAGTDVLRFELDRPGVRVDLAAGLTEAGDALRAIETVVGTDSDDVLMGSEGPDVLRGGGGDDLVYGRGGADRIDGQEDEDQVDGGPGDDQLSGGQGVDHVTGGAGVDGYDLLSPLPEEQGDKRPAPEPDRAVCDRDDLTVAYDVRDAFSGACTTARDPDHPIEVGPPAIRTGRRPTLTYRVRLAPDGDEPVDVRLTVRERDGAALGTSRTRRVGRGRVVITVPLRRPLRSSATPVEWPLVARVRVPGDDGTRQLRFGSARYPGLGPATLG